MSIENRLKWIINDKRLKIKNISMGCEIPYRTLQNYLSNQRPISVDATIKICTYLGVNINWLMTGEGEIYRERKTNEKITQPQSELFLTWLNEWWEQADDKHRNWLEVQMKRCFPEYAEWLLQHEKSLNEESNS